MKQIELLQYLKRIPAADPYRACKVETLYLEYLQEKAIQELQYLRKKK